VELVGAVDRARTLEQLQRRLHRAPGRLDDGLVLRRVLVGLEQDSVELLAHRRRAAARGEFARPGVDLGRDLLLALYGQQRGLDLLLGRLAEHALALAAEVVRRLEQPEQRGGLLLDAGGGLEVVAGEVGEAELALGREFPRQVEVDLLRQGLPGREELRRRGLLEAQQRVGGLDLHALARVELDLHRALGLGHHAAGKEAAGIFEEGIHRSGLSPVVVVGLTGHPAGGAGPVSGKPHPGGAGRLAKIGAIGDW